MDIPADLIDLALHLEGKAKLSDALAADCANNSEHARAQQYLRRAANARKYVKVCNLAAEALREKNTRKKAATLEASEDLDFKALNRLFGRTGRAVWSDGEMKQYRALQKAGVLTEENLTMLTKYYATERSKGEEGRHRRDLGTFLNNFTGELDRARAAIAPTAKPKEVDPPGWREWLTKRGFEYEAHEYAPKFRRDDFKGGK